MTERIWSRIGMPRTTPRPSPRIRLPSGGLAVHARALGGFSKDLALLVQVLDGVALVLGTLGDDHGAILKRDGHAVVRLARLDGVDGLGVLGADVLGLINLGYAIAIRK